MLRKRILTRLKTVDINIKGELGMATKARKCINSYKVVGISSPPRTEYIPLDDKRRRQQETDFLLEFHVSLPNYDDIIRDHLHPCDLRVLCKEYVETYEYRGGLFRDTYYIGYITDGASVPNLLAWASLVKDGQQIQEPAQGHDKDFADHRFSFFDSNCLFRARIEQQERWGNKRAGRSKRRYSFGVNSPTAKKIYSESKPGTNWMQGFYKHEILKPMEW